MASKSAQRRHHDSEQPHPAWKQFSKEHGKHPAVQMDVLYALPAELINSIEQEVPNFFRSEDLAFERDLTRLSGCGFFCNSPLHYSPLVPAYRFSAKPSELDLRMERSSAEIDTLLSAEMKKSGRTSVEIDAYFDRRTIAGEMIRRRQVGYLGWLATNLEFRRDCDEMRQKWRNKVIEIGAMPRLPISPMGTAHPPVPKSERAYHTSWNSFFLKWGVETLITWDLPLPMRPELNAPALYNLNDVDDGGVLIFVPWFLLRDRDISVYQIAEHQALLANRNHLKDWLEKRPRNWGYDRYSDMLQLFVFFALAIKSRYSQNLSGSVLQLDYAFARFLLGGTPKAHQLTTKQETVRRIRLELMRRLRWNRKSAQRGKC